MLLVQDRAEGYPTSAPLYAHRRVTHEHLEDGSPYVYSAHPVVLTSKTGAPQVLGGGDNPLLTGGLLMAMFSIEHMLGVSRHSLTYATKLLEYFESSQKAKGKHYRRRHWWHPEVHISKDEMTGMLLGLDFYLKATKGSWQKSEHQRARTLMHDIGVYLRDNKYSPAFAWVFQFPFTRLFKFNLGTSMLSGVTIPNNPNVGDELLNKIISLLRAMSMLNRWYKPKHLYRDTMRYLSWAYRTATRMDYKRKFFNVALFCHTSQMIFSKPVKSKVRKEIFSSFNKMFDYFAREGSASGQGDGYDNAYLGVVAHAFANSVPTSNNVSRASEMYKPVLSPEGIWAPNLPLCCLPGSQLLKHYYGDDDRYYGDRFTWEHRDAGGHYLNWSWQKTHGEIGPPSRLDLEDLDPTYNFADPSKGFVVEAAGLGLVFVRALAAHYGLADPPHIKDDTLFPVLPLDGPAPS